MSLEMEAIQFTLILALVLIGFLVPDRLIRNWLARRKIEQARLPNSWEPQRPRNFRLYDL